jgi:hypothetical protein
MVESLLGFMFFISILFMWKMFKLSQNSRLNQSGRYEFHVQDRREARRRRRSRERAEKEKKEVD